MGTSSGEMRNMLSGLLKKAKRIPFDIKEAEIIAQISKELGDADYGARAIRKWAKGRDFSDVEKIYLAKIYGYLGFAGWAAAILENITDAQLAELGEMDLRVNVLRLSCQFKEAMPYVEAVPRNDLVSWLQYATALSLQYDQNFFKARSIFDQLRAQMPNSAELHSNIAPYYINLLGQFNQGMGAAYIAADSDLAPPIRLRAYQLAVEAAVLADNKEVAGKIAQAFFAYLETYKQVPGYEPQLIEAIYSYIKFLVDDETWTEHLVTDASLVNLSSKNLDRYGQHCARFLKNLRAKIAGRDVCIVLPGPSVKQLAPHAANIKRKSPDVIFAAVNKVSQIQDTILNGTELDIFACVTGETIRPQEEMLWKFMKQKNNPMLISSDISLKSLSRLPDAPLGPSTLALSDGKTSPSTPEHPLRNQGINGLYALMMVLLIGKPKRIFLFGADGASSAKSDYFFAMKGEEKMKTDSDLTRSDARNVRLILDSLRFSLHMPFQLANTACLFGVDIPEIYNINADSKITNFEQIPIEQAVSMLTEAQN